MTFDEYQVQAKQTAVYPKTQGIQYTVIGLNDEAGELLGKLKKWMRGDYNFRALQNGLEAELGDVLWYAAMLATELGVSLEDVAQANLDKLASRQERGSIQGEGDER